MDFAKVLKNPYKVNFKEADIKYVKYLGFGEHLLHDVATNSDEIWFSNKNHASFGLTYKNTHLEFARTA
jgi:hypothetical protein